MNSPIWLYWNDNPIPETVQFCIDTIRHHNQDVHMLGIPAFRDCCADLGIPYPPPFVAPQHEADLLRAWILARRGGWWIDCDYLCLKPVAGLLEQLEARHTFGAYKHKAADGAAYVVDLMWARHGSPIAAAYLDRIVRHLKIHGKPMKWDAIGADALNPAIAAHPLGLIEWAPEMASPFRCSSGNLDCEMPGEVPIPPAAVGIMLLNSGSNEYLGEKPIAEWKKTPTVIGSLLRQAAERMKTT